VLQLRVEDPPLATDIEFAVKLRAGVNGDGGAGGGGGSFPGWPKKVILSRKSDLRQPPLLPTLVFVTEPEAFV
jgi:hypothetical protein